LHVRDFRFAAAGSFRFRTLIRVRDESGNRSKLWGKTAGGVSFSAFASGRCQGARLPVIRNEVRKPVLGGQKNSAKSDISLLPGDATRIEFDLDAEPTRFLGFLFLLTAGLLKLEGLATVYQRETICLNS
jgi:hypothetical protein